MLAIICLHTCHKHTHSRSVSVCVCEYLRVCNVIIIARVIHHIYMRWSRCCSLVLWQLASVYKIAPHQIYTSSTAPTPHTQILYHTHTHTRSLGDCVFESRAALGTITRARCALTHNETLGQRGDTNLWWLNDDYVYMARGSAHTHTHSMCIHRSESLL